MNQSIFYDNKKDNIKKYNEKNPCKDKENNNDEFCNKFPSCIVIGPTGATGTDQIVEMTIVETTTINSVLTVRNPQGNAAALTITPLAGGTQAVSAHLVILQIA